MNPLGKICTKIDHLKYEDLFYYFLATYETSGEGNVKEAHTAAISLARLCCISFIGIQKIFANSKNLTST